MPHRCTKCGRVYPKGAKEILEGCQCGNRLFMFFREISKEEAEALKGKNTREIIDKKLVEELRKKPRTDQEIWNIKAEDGVYEIDVASLMMKEPVIVAGDEGRYILSLSSAFKKEGKQVKYTKRKRK
jgi:predicted  nucleic acid-binding Zn-ribbon protein